MDKRNHEQMEKYQPQPILETERLFLRPFALADAKELQLLAGDFSVADTTLTVPHPYLDGLAEEWISTHATKYEQEEAVIFATTLKRNNSLVGAIELSLTQRFRRAELGYWIAKPAWNQGYATEAAKTVIEFGFSVLALHKIVGSHFNRNPSSGRVMRKLGFRQEGILQDHIMRWGRFEDVVIYGLIR